MDKRNGFYLLILFCGCVWTKDGKHDYCMKMSTWGFTVPSGDITNEYGKPLSITCNLYEEKAEKYGDQASSRLFFMRNEEIIPSDMVEIINSTSIRLYIEEPAKTGNDNYYCYFNESQQTKNETKMYICYNHVVVGVAPQPVTNFSCIGRNYDNLTCTWNTPDNYVKTEYNLSYTFKGRAGRKTRFFCPVLTKEENSMSCYWNISTKPQYRQVQKFFDFTLNVTNVFGSRLFNFSFDHFKHVVSNPPENLTAIATSPHSIHLSWVVPKSMVGFVPGLDHRILFQCEYYEKKWQFGGYINNSLKNETLRYDLTNLKYAHALCDIRVSMRSQAARDDENMWSEFSSKTLRTLSDIPDGPPRTTQGSFEIVNNQFYRDAYVYWQQIGEEQKNGQNFSYVVESHPHMRPTELTRAYAKFQNLSVSRYVISVWSKNDEGNSTRKSTVIIPETRLMEPKNFIKLEHPGLTPDHDLYELTWDPPKTTEKEITNYTLFWCNNDRDRPHQCVGNLNWTVLTKDTFKYNMSLPKSNIYQFAISADSENSSSGMSWAECTIIANKIVGKMRNVWISQVGSTFIELGWKLECTDRIQTVRGYVIYYCPIKSTQEKQCTKNVRNVTIHGDKSVQSGRVENLKPYTMYLLTVSVIMSHSTHSQSSDTMRNTTREAAPSTPPLDVNVSNITHSSITLTWAPPAECNGILKYYRIHYRTETEKRTQEVLNNLNNFTLTNLQSYQKYWISMQACTVDCSDSSDERLAVTRMWLPGVIDRPNVIFQNDSVTTIGWKKPYPPRGQINYYQVKFTRNNFENVSLEPDINVTNAQNYSIDNCGESGKYNTFFVSIRAVNIIDGEHKAGPWSEPLESYCRRYSPLLYVVLCVFLIFVIVGLFLLFRKIYAWCKVMQDVEVKLPPGLAPVVEQHDLVLWGSEKHPDDIDRTSRADEELLLDKISDMRTSGDSSGCSSGHESITSSLESTTHMSMDSGTDQPRNMSEENRRNSLRQRNVSSKGYVLPEAIPTSINWGSKTTPAPAGNYCVIGVDLTNKPSGDPPYLQTTDASSTISIPYISCDLPPNIPPPFLLTSDLIKTPNPGYIPYSDVESASKNTGYVVAGLTKDLLVSDIRQCDVINPSSTNIDEKKPYMKLAETSTNIKGVQHPWQSPTLEASLTKPGYVSVGDASPPKIIKEITKGYVPHRQFEAKSLKED